MGVPEGDEAVSGLDADAKAHGVVSRFGMASSVAIPAIVVFQDTADVLAIGASRWLVVLPPGALYGIENTLELTVGELRVHRRQPRTRARVFPDQCAHAADYQSPSTVHKLTPAPIVGYPLFARAGELPEDLRISTFCCAQGVVRKAEEC